MGVALGFTGSSKTIGGAGMISACLLKPVMYGKSPVTGELISEIVTGGCIHVDAAVGRTLATKMPTVKHTVVVPSDRSKVDPWWIDFPEVEVVEMPPGTDYMDRDDELIRRSDELMAFPNRTRTLRSGTWATVRRAEGKGIPWRAVLLTTGEDTR
jgi:hypothetical protein